MAIKLADTLEPLANFPAALAKDIQFDDKENLQDKFNSGTFGGNKVSLADVEPTYKGSLGELVFNTKQGKNECVGWIYTPFGWYSFGNISNITEDIETNYVLNDGKNLRTSDGMIFAVSTKQATANFLLSNNKTLYTSDNMIFTAK